MTHNIIRYTSIIQIAGVCVCGGEGGGVVFLFVVVCVFVFVLGGLFCGGGVNYLFCFGFFVVVFLLFVCCLFLLAGLC